MWFRSLETAGDASPDVAYEYVGELRMGDEDDEPSSRGMDTDNARAGLQFLPSKAGVPVDVIGGVEPITTRRQRADPGRARLTAELTRVGEVPWRRAGRAWARSGRR